MTSPRLIFESTRNFSQSEIQPVVRSFEKFLVNPNLYAIIPPPGEKCGLGFMQFSVFSAQHIEDGLVIQMA
jgi:hypothetical protein